MLLSEIRVLGSCWGPQQLHDDHDDDDDDGNSDRDGVNCRAELWTTKINKKILVAKVILKWFFSFPFGYIILKFWLEKLSYLLGLFYYIPLIPSIGHVGNQYTSFLITIGLTILGLNGGVRPDRQFLNFDIILIKAHAPNFNWSLFNYTPLIPWIGS